MVLFIKVFVLPGEDIAVLVRRWTWLKLPAVFEKYQLWKQMSKENSTRLYDTSETSLTRI